MGVLDLLCHVGEVAGMLVLLGVFHTLWLASWTWALEAKDEPGRLTGIMITLAVVIAWGLLAFLIARGLAV